MITNKRRGKGKRLLVREEAETVGGRKEKWKGRQGLLMNENRIKRVTKEQRKKIRKSSKKRNKRKERKCSHEGTEHQLR